LIGWLRDARHVAHVGSHFLCTDHHNTRNHALSTCRSFVSRHSFRHHSTFALSLSPAYLPAITVSESAVSEFPLNPCPSTTCQNALPTVSPQPASPITQLLTWCRRCCAALLTQCETRQLCPGHGECAPNNNNSNKASANNAAQNGQDCRYIHPSREPH
jgi:hypothetical protein